MGKRNYLDKNELLVETLKSKERGIATNKLAMMLEKMFVELQKMPKLNNVDQELKDEVRAGAMELVIKKANKFDEEKYDNAFAFFTRVCYNALQLSYNNIKKGSKITIHYSSVFQDSDI